MSSLLQEAAAICAIPDNPEDYIPFGSQRYPIWWFFWKSVGRYQNMNIWQCDDLTMDVLMQAIESIEKGRYNPEYGNLLGYCLGIAKNTRRQFWRQVRLFEKYKESLIEEGEQRRLRRLAHSERYTTPVGDSAIYKRPTLMLAVVRHSRPTENRALSNVMRDMRLKFWNETVFEWLNDEGDKYMSQRDRLLFQLRYPSVGGGKRGLMPLDQTTRVYNAAASFFGFNELSEAGVRQVVSRVGKKIRTNLSHERKKVQ